LANLDRLPPTLQHGDAGRKNLFSVTGPNGEDETLAIDWGFVGLGAVGEEIAAIVLSGLIWFNGVEPEDLSEIERLAFAGYVQGLRDVGWDDDERAVRLGYTAGLALRFGMLLFEVGVVDGGNRAEAARVRGHPIEEAIDRWALMRRQVLRCAEEARRLDAAL
jgi:hypothetical protein